jgi:CHRD domain
LRWCVGARIIGASFNRYQHFDRMACMPTNSKTQRRGWTIPGILIGTALLLFGHAVIPQNVPGNETFKARLTPVPIDVTMMSTVAGIGSLTAVLAGKQVTITGTFEGLRSPATTAQIHRGPKGLRGPAIFDLTISKAVKGTISGSFELTPEQMEDLRNARWYVQIQSEGAPDGNLWGWLLR